MVSINIISMIIAALLLSWMLMCTRCHDSVGWWAFRVLSCYALVCFVYLAYDINVAGNVLLIKYLFMRFGFLALVIAMFILWRLMTVEKKTNQKRDFDIRLKGIFKIGE